MFKKITGCVLGGKILDICRGGYGREYLILDIRECECGCYDLEFHECRFGLLIYSGIREKCNYSNHDEKSLLPNMYEQNCLGDCVIFL